jgi:hypothetical protein
MNTHTTSNGIYGAMASVMREIGHIGKDSKNTAQGFKFRGIDAVYNELHGLLAKHGIVTLPTAGVPVTEERVNKNGTTLRFVQLPMSYQFTHEDGSSVSCLVIGEGMDSGDKATNKAMAIAHKYALLQTFLIPTEEQADPDYETHEVQPKVSKPVFKDQQESDPHKELAGLMTRDRIEESVIFDFLSSKGVLPEGAQFIFDLPPKVVARLVEKWDELIGKPTTNK